VASAGLVHGNLRTFEISYVILRTSRVRLYHHPILRYLKPHFSGLYDAPFKLSYTIFAYELKIGTYCAYIEVLDIPPLNL
jgi:hypothetical protein